MQVLDPSFSRKVLLPGLAPVLEVNQRYGYSAEKEDLVTASDFAVLYSAQQSVVCWSLAMWSTRERNSTAFFSLLPRRSKPLQVGGDPVAGGNTAGWEVRGEQLCVMCLFCSSCFRV